MTGMIQQVANLNIWKDRRGQDLVEFALMAGFMAVAAAAILPDVVSSVNTILTRVNSVMISAASNPVSHLI